MWKWLILILAIYVLYRLFANDILKKKRVDKEESAADLERKVAAGEMVKDPECGTYVSVDGNISVRDGDKIYRFCSYDCRDKFCSAWKRAAGNCSHASREPRSATHI